MTDINAILTQRIVDKTKQKKNDLHIEHVEREESPFLVLENPFSRKLTAKYFRNANNNQKCVVRRKIIALVT